MADWIKDYESEHLVLDEIYEDKDHLYILRTSIPFWKAYYTPYDTIKNGAMGNISQFGDWLSNTPFCISVLKKFGVTNPYKDIVDNEKVYYIGLQNDNGEVLIYIRDHYFKTARFEYVKSIGRYDVYSILSE